MRIQWRGTRADLIAALRSLPRTLTGVQPDATGVAEGSALRMGGVLLSKIQEAYETASEGGTNELGIAWAPLAPSTLALRNKGTGTKTLSKLRGQLLHLPSHRKRLIQIQRNRLLKVYEVGGASQRRQALRFLKAMQPFISKARFQKLTREIKTQKPARGAQLAFSGGFATILRDTGGLFNSLSPKVGPDTVLAFAPGSITVGSNKTTPSGLNLLELHDSDKPRKKKKDGTDRLPRRQVLPDSAHPIPQQWWDEMLAAYLTAVNQRGFWLAYLGQRAS